MLEDRVILWAKETGVNYSTVFGSGTRIVYVYSKAIAMWFEQEFGSGAWNKRFPGWLFTAPVADQMDVIKFYFLGDGSFWDESRSSCRATSRSKILAQTVHFLLLSADYCACIGQALDHGEPIYKVEVNGASAVKLAEFFEVQIPTRGIGRSQRYNYARKGVNETQIPIRNVQTFSYQGPVYNLEVEKDHSYCVPISAHNCWIEKDALIGVIENVCKELDIAYFSCRGYTSQSEMWSAAMRLQRYRKGRQKPLVLHLGDHDPSGKDMTRDITDRLSEFSEGTIEVRRLALNMSQITQYHPPPNPAKITDSRAAGYIAEFGGESWELDALEPAVIATLIRDAVFTVRDVDKWVAQQLEEDTQKAQLEKVSNQWKNIINNLE